MLAVQKPPAFFSPSPAYLHRPNHSRHPSAPVVIRPTHTPGLLSMSKPAQQQPPKQQQAQQYQRAQKQSPRGKNQRSPQPAPAQAHPVEEDKKSSQSKQRATAPSDKVAKSATAAPSSEKPIRGRQSAKPASKDQADRSASNPRTHARRLPHQPSPTRIPQQTESSAPVNPFRAQSFVHRDQDSNLFDPFVVSSSDNESTESTVAATVAGNDKPLSFRAPPQLSSRPSGKLARRRQSGQADNLTPSKPIPAGRKGHKSHVSQSGPVTVASTPQRPPPRRTTTELPVADWDDFPICDDMTVISSPTTPVHESASVPPKRSGITWQQSLIDDAPHTAPLSSSFSSYTFPSTAPFSTPPPANRRRNHRRVPSEGVFAMSMDEESSDSSDELRNAVNQLHLSGKQRGPRRTPPPTADSAPASFYAGSVWQNSPSPDELPVPAFRA